MSDPAPKPPLPSDPFELWRQIYETNEQAWNAALERSMSTPAFAESSGKLLETFLGAQKTVRDNMRQYLETINVPTRDDIARLGELIGQLEEKVDQLADRFDNVEQLLRGKARDAAPSTPPTPTPTPTPPTETRLVDRGESVDEIRAVKPSAETPPDRPPTRPSPRRGQRPSGSVG